MHAVPQGTLYPRACRVCAVSPCILYPCAHCTCAVSLCKLCTGCISVHTVRAVSPCTLHALCPHARCACAVSPCTLHPCARCVRCVLPHAVSLCPLCLHACPMSAVTPSRPQTSVRTQQLSPQPPHTHHPPAGGLGPPLPPRSDAPLGRLAPPPPSAARSPPRGRRGRRSRPAARPSSLRAGPPPTPRAAGPRRPPASPPAHRPAAHAPSGGGEGRGARPLRARGDLGGVPGCGGPFPPAVKAVLSLASLKLAGVAFRVSFWLLFHGFCTVRLHGWRCTGAASAAAWKPLLQTQLRSLRCCNRNSSAGRCSRARRVQRRAHPSGAKCMQCTSHEDSWCKEHAVHITFQSMVHAVHIT